MNQEKYGVNNSGGRYRLVSEPKDSFLDSVPACFIISSVAIGMNTKKSLVKEQKFRGNKKKDSDGNKEYQYDFDKAIEKGLAPSTIDLHVKKLEDERFLVIVNPKKKINRRKGEFYRYQVNYDKLTELLIKIFISDVGKQKQLIENAIKKIKNRILVLQRKLKKYKKLAKSEENKRLAKKYAKIRAKLNVKELFMYTFMGKLSKIDPIGEKVREIKHSIGLYERMKIDLDIFSNISTEATYLKVTDLSDREHNVIGELLKCLFYFNHLTLTDKKRTLRDTLKLSLEHIRKGIIIHFTSTSLNGSSEGIGGYFTSPITDKAYPSLYKMKKYWDTKDTLMGFY